MTAFAVSLLGFAVGSMPKFVLDVLGCRVPSKVCKAVVEKPLWAVASYITTGTRTYKGLQDQGMYTNPPFRAGAFQADGQISHWGSWPRDQFSPPHGHLEAVLADDNSVHRADPSRIGDLVEALPSFNGKPQFTLDHELILPDWHR